jgi:hypothetical protein
MRGVAFKGVDTADPHVHVFGAELFGGLGVAVGNLSLLGQHVGGPVEGVFTGGIDQGDAGAGAGEDLQQGVSVLTERVVLLLAGQHAEPFASTHHGPWKNNTPNTARTAPASSPHPAHRVAPRLMFTHSSASGQTPVPINHVARRTFWPRGWLSP